MTAFLSRLSNSALAWLVCMLMAAAQVQIQAQAQESTLGESAFIISNVRVVGLQRITEGTVFNHMPFQVGDRFSDANTASTIRSLYQTGFFDDVRLEREGDVLIVEVVERPAIGQITFTGNKKVKTEDLQSGLAEVGFVEGRVFDRRKLRDIRRELMRQYFALGRYAMSIRSDVSEMSENRVAIEINIDEGGETRISSINIIGNEDFTEKKLLKKFESRARWYSSFTGGKRYSREALAGDLETLRSHYLDIGYVRFQILSTQVSITPDRRDIHVTINIREGEPYVVSDVRLAGDVAELGDDVADLVRMRRGVVFSRKETNAASERLSYRLGEKGYAFANVNMVPDIDDEKKEVIVSFVIDKAQRAYVRRINFIGNETTRDVVLRREMRQQEASWLSTTQVERGKLRLERLGFFSGVTVETPAVPDKPDQVDVDYSVNERPAGNLLIGLGYTQNQGPTIRFSITQNNFLGSGNRVGADFDNSSVNRRFRINYFNPYYTIDGVSRGFNVGYREVDSAEANITSYDIRSFDAGVSFGVPISENDYMSVGLNYESSKFSNIGSSTVQSVRNFTQRHGTSYDIFRASSGWTYDTRNRALLPDAGQRHRVSIETSLPLLSDNVNFYKVSHRGELFLPLTESWVFLLRDELSYGDGYGGTSELPFFERFYLGGPRSLRGFEENTVGPRDSSNRALGGDLKVFGSAELILPLPFLEVAERQFRITAFHDVGNVYNLSDDSLSSGPLRYSAGLGALWLSPVGILTISLSRPYGSKPGDRTQGFQFTFGTSF